MVTAIQRLIELRAVFDEALISQGGGHFEYTYFLWSRLNHALQNNYFVFFLAFIDFTWQNLVHKTLH